MRIVIEAGEFRENWGSGSEGTNVIMLELRRLGEVGL